MPRASEFVVEMVKNGGVKVADSGSELEEHDLMLNPTEQNGVMPIKEQARVPERIKTFSLMSLKQNWRKLAALVCLWIAYFICTIGLSLLAPFFPLEVCTIASANTVRNFLLAIQSCMHLEIR